MSGSAETQAPAARVAPRHRRAIALAGGLGGAIIGPSGLWLHVTIRVAQNRAEKWVPMVPSGGWSNFLDRMLHSWTGVLIFAVPFVATLALMPWVIRTLERAATQPARRYYRRAATTGVALGLFASAIITIALFGTAVLWGYFHPTVGQPEGGIVELIIGVLIFGTLTAIVIPLIFAPYILLFGIPFGLGLGFAVRKAAAKR